MRERKRQVRAGVRDAVARQTEQQRHAASLAACSRLFDLPEFRRSTSVLAYLPMPGEVNVEPAIHAAWREGKVVSVPLADWSNRHMQPVLLTSLAAEHVSVGLHGVRYPTALSPVAVSSIELVIVPGLAFDQGGGRLGRGGGFYDRFLGSLASSVITIGVAFEAQVVPAVPREPHDACVKIVVTEGRTIRCV